MLRKQLASLQLAYDSVNQAHNIRAASSPAPPSAFGLRSAPHLFAPATAAPRGLASSVPSQTRARDLEAALAAARAENAAIRQQYVDRVTERRDETFALVEAQGRALRTVCRTTSARLLAYGVARITRRVPLRRAFAQWRGLAAAASSTDVYRKDRWEVRRLQDQVTELGGELRRAEAHSRSLEGRLSSQRAMTADLFSSRSPNRHTGTVSQSQDLRVRALEQELRRERQDHLALQTEAERLRRAETRARTSETILRTQISNTSRQVPSPTMYSKMQAEIDVRDSTIRDLEGMLRELETRLTRQESAGRTRPALQPRFTTTAVPVHRSVDQKTALAAARPVDRYLPPPKTQAPPPMGRTRHLEQPQWRQQQQQQQQQSPLGSPASSRKTSPVGADFLGFGVRRLDADEDDTKDLVAAAKPSTSAKRGSFFGTYDGASGRAGHGHKASPLRTRRTSSPGGDGDLLDRVYRERAVSPAGVQHKSPKWNKKAQRRRRASLGGQKLL